MILFTETGNGQYLEELPRSYGRVSTKYASTEEILEVICEHNPHRLVIVASHERSTGVLERTVHVDNERSVDRKRKHER